jgi:hypothetical protein
MELIELLDRERTAIVSEALASIQRAGLQHYQASGIEACRARLQSLYVVMYTSIAGRTLMPIEKHAEDIASERFRSGFGLGEVQTAFNVLEEAIWKRIETEIPREDLARSLALVSTVLGSGKDRLARAYVELATQSQVPALDVQALFRAPNRS